MNEKFDILETRNEKQQTFFLKISLHKNIKCYQTYRLTLSQCVLTWICAVIGFHIHSEYKTLCSARDGRVAVIAGRICSIM